MVVYFSDDAEIIDCAFHANTAGEARASCIAHAASLTHGLCLRLRGPHAPPPRALTHSCIAEFGRGLVVRLKRRVAEGLNGLQQHRCRGARSLPCLLLVGLGFSIVAVVLTGRECALASLV